MLRRTRPLLLSVVVVFFVSLLTWPVVAQEKEQPRPGGIQKPLQQVGSQKTATPEDARYEIVQSGLEAWWTLKLDRYTGKVYQLVRTEKKDLL